MRFCSFFGVTYVVLATFAMANPAVRRFLSIFPDVPRDHVIVSSDVAGVLPVLFQLPASSRDSGMRVLQEYKRNPARPLGDFHFVFKTVNNVSHRSVRFDPFLAQI